MIRWKERLLYRNCQPRTVILLILCLSPDLIAIWAMAQGSFFGLDRDDDIHAMALDVGHAGTYSYKTTNIILDEPNPA
jgi:hypothetical protein